MLLNFVAENCAGCQDCETMFPGILKRLENGCTAILCKEVTLAFLAIRACKNRALYTNEEL